MLKTPDSPNAVNTIEDVIRLLRERPDVREAARREILTDEILEMPKKLDELIELHRQMAMRQDRQDVRMDKQDARMDKQDDRLDNMENTQQRILETLAEHSRQLVVHSRMLGNLTGCPAYPAVAGFSHAPIAEQRLAGDSIHWHRMPSSAMDPR